MNSEMCRPGMCLMTVNLLNVQPVADCSLDPEDRRAQARNGAPCPLTIPVSEAHPGNNPHPRGASTVPLDVSRSGKAPSIAPAAPGRILSIRGPVVDVAFSEDMPTLHEA